MLPDPQHTSSLVTLKIDLHDEPLVKTSVYIVLFKKKIETNQIPIQYYNMTTEHVNHKLGLLP